MQLQTLLTEMLEKCRCRPTMSNVDWHFSTLSRHSIDIFRHSNDISNIAWQPRSSHGFGWVRFVSVSPHFLPFLRDFYGFPHLPRKCASSWVIYSQRLKSWKLEEWMSILESSTCSSMTILDGITNAIWRSMLTRPSVHTKSPVLSARLRSPMPRERLRSPGPRGADGWPRGHPSRLRVLALSGVTFVWASPNLLPSR